MGTKYFAMRDIDMNTNRRDWPYYYEEREDGFVQRPMMMRAYSDFEREMLKRTMLEHEATFRTQVYELHRLYRIQKDLMQEYQKKEYFHRYPASQTNSFSSHAAPPPNRNYENSPIFGRDQITVKPSFEFTREGSVQSSANETPFAGKKPFDLRLPADEYIENGKGNRNRNGNGFVMGLANGEGSNRREESWVSDLNEPVMERKNLNLFGLSRDFFGNSRADEGSSSGFYGVNGKVKEKHFFLDRENGRSGGNINYFNAERNQHIIFQDQVTTKFFGQTYQIPNPVNNSGKSPLNDTNHWNHRNNKCQTPDFTENLPFFSNHSKIANTTGLPGNLNGINRGFWSDSVPPTHPQQFPVRPIDPNRVNRVQDSNSEWPKDLNLNEAAVACESNDFENGITCESNCKDLTIRESPVTRILGCPLNTDTSHKEKPLIDLNERENCVGPAPKRAIIDLNEELPFEINSEQLESKGKRVNHSIDLEGPVLFDLNETHDSDSDLITEAANNILSLSRDERKLQNIPTSSPFDPLQWFADLAVSNTDKTDSDDDVSDLFESMTLKLEETKCEERFCPKNSIDKQPEKEGENLSLTGYGSLLLTRPRRGQRRRQKRNFQKDILPGLASLSRHEVTEDLQTIGGLMKACGKSFDTGLMRRAKGKRQQRAPLPVVMEQMLPPVQHGSGCVDMAGEGLGVIGWGRTTRRCRRQRLPPAQHGSGSAAPPLI